MDEYLKRVFEAVIQNEELERMSPGMGRLLVEQVGSRRRCFYFHLDSRCWKVFIVTFQKQYHSSSGQAVANPSWGYGTRMQKHETTPSRSSKLPQGTLSNLFENRTLDEGEVTTGESWRGVLWFRTTKNWDVITGLLVRPLALLTRTAYSFVCPSLLALFARRSFICLITHSRDYEKVNDKTSQY